MPPKATLEEENLMIEAYLSGLSAAKAAALIGYSKPTCLNVLKRRGIKRRSPIETKGITPEIEKAMVEEYLNGTPAFKIAKKYKHSADACYSALARSGVEKRSYVESRSRKYRVNHTFFNSITTESQAYWLGFITADGAIFRQYVAITLHSDDKQHLYKWREAIQAEQPITEIKRGERSYSRISIPSKRITDDLFKLGVTKRKSLTVKPCEQVPEHLRRHYWRGIIDGDGSIFYTARNKTWTFNLVGSKYILEGFRQFIFEHTGSKAKTLPTKNIFKINFTGKSLAKSVAKLLYEDATIYLDRKKALADVIMKLEVTRNLERYG